MDFSLPKRERLCSHNDIGNLIGNGHYFTKGPLRCCYVPGAQVREDAQADASVAVPARPDVRILVSVPKKNFRRAVRRNLLKRRIREAFRLQKGAFPSLKADIMFIYVTKDICSYAEIHESVGAILKTIDEQQKLR